MISLSSTLAGAGNLVRPQFITHLVVALVAGLLFGALAWFFQAARLGADLSDSRMEVAQLKEQAKSDQLAGERRLRQAEGFHNARYNKAIHAAGNRERALRASRDSARNVAEGLQRKLDTADERLAAATREAAIEYGIALNKVFGQCKDRYRELGARADGHASDVQTCRAAWPAFGPEQEPMTLIQGAP